MKKIAIVLFLILFCIGCDNATILFYTDEKYTEIQPKENSIFTIVKQAAKEEGFRVKIEYVKVDQLEPDLTPLIEKRKEKLIILSPYLSKKILTYAQNFKSKYFCALDSYNRTTESNIISLVKNREDYFKMLAKEVYDLQRGGYKVGCSFLLSDKRRQTEKQLFDSALKTLNNGNYPIEDFPLYRSDNNRAARDVYIRMNSNNIDYLLLFCGSLVVDIIEEFPTACQMKVITEGFYPSDNIYKEFICYAINYDYSKAVASLIECLKAIEMGKVLSGDELNILLTVKAYQIGESLPVFEETKTEDNYANQEGIDESHIDDENAKHKEDGEEQQEEDMI